MPVKIARSTPRPSFGLPELLVASHISRLAFRDAAKSLLSTLVSESSGECRVITPTTTDAIIRVWTHDMAEELEHWQMDASPYRSQSESLGMC